MTLPGDLDLLAAIAERSPEGVGVPVDTIREMGFADIAAALARLEDDGLVQAISDSGAHPHDPAARAAAQTVAMTEAGWAALGQHPRRL